MPVDGFKFFNIAEEYFRKPSIKMPSGFFAKKVNNLMSKIFALIFKSDRAACIAQVKELGLLGHAKKMAAARTQTIKKK